ncbi:Tm-1-like ATP-binding domain-containing protein [Variovorax sp. E3]|uniref:Tm-1-like ATP-binding domain-containing protein n=1 Tax=Variovorax sp. E3 TaxID=1914993 RepID=UPI0018DC4939|nr:Tm-1-like ATP-binding domain-containing protein [Variovorax sp. E3]
MRATPTILLIGTADTKSDELLFIRERIAAAGGRVLFMDVGVLAPGRCTPDIRNDAVAEAAGTALEAVRDCGDENRAMTVMARGASVLAAQLHAAGRIDGMLALGGTMGTDLALDVAEALPLGVPKLVLSTIAYSHLIPPERVAPDLIMALWAGGLYGLNSLCRSSLAQAAGAVVGACRGAEVPRRERPLVGMTSLGTSGLRYMRRLKPALEARGYELAVFHTTGMGGRAFESIAAQRGFVAVMDFSLQEVANHVAGSCVTAGPDRLLGAGRAGVPQIVAPGAVDMVDFQAWQAVPARYADRPQHAHNRLIASASTAPEMRREVARGIGRRLGAATGPTCLLLPLGGIEEWDRPGQPLHDPEGLAAFVDEMRACAPANVRLVELDAHINDDVFADAAMAVFDAWVSDGLIAAGARP